jgi:hypothetical protein
LIFAGVLLFGVVTSQAADDASCLASPTRACVLTIAVNAIEPVVAQKTPADADRMLVIWRTAQAVIQSAADAGQFALAMGLVSRFDNSYYGVELGPLFVAMKIAGRAKDLAPIQAKLGQGDATLDMWTGPALATLSGRRRSNPRRCASSSNSASSTPGLLGRRGPDSLMSAACACRSPPAAHRFWPGASAPRRGARRPMPRPAGRSLLSLYRDARGLDVARTSPGSGAR